MLNLLCKLYLNSKSTKKDTTIFPPTVLYSPLEKCTWRFSLLEMNTPNYLLLYGLCFNKEYTLDELRNIVVNESMNLWRDLDYVEKKGRSKTKSTQRDTEIAAGDNIYNIFAILVIKHYILDTTDKDVTDYIKSNETEKEAVLLGQLCLNKNFGVYKYPPKVKPVRENSRLLEILEPALFKVVDTNHILDGAVGETEIKNLITKYNNKQTKTKSKAETSNQKPNQPVKKQSTVKKEGQLFVDDGENQILETVGKVEEGVENLISKIIKR